MAVSRSIKLSARDVGKRYGAAVALADATFDLAEGEFLTLLGPSGSGKTTLLMIVAGLVPPSSGEILIDGRPATNLASCDRDIGMVFQSYALFPHLTVAENVAFPLEMRRLPKHEVETRVREALDLVRLGHLADRLPARLSGGQQQRVALARAMIYRPSIILMDEPLGALDKKLREHMQSEIRRLHHELSITVLYVTHDQDEAMGLSNRICLMNNARIEQIGTPDELYFRPSTPFAANFIGESNLLPVTVASRDGDIGEVRTATGVTLRGRTVPTSPVSGDALLAVRPERLLLLDEGASSENRLVGTVRDSVMLGALTRVEIEPAGGGHLAALLLTAGRARPRVGEVVRLGWPADAGIVLPCEAA
ncbi:ABC transporter ATP-binding protein [Methylobacterium nodulans]|uniref:ABC transporter related n=1 Tax=Methylobacterium nodulans (strain LMG 21967 / CNCM I-2342 / ORS 2060) TaxID=460265 RepID=B8IA76_METNO|nr:ABC transporter ATP-binding protein [Methylobacterium nodulans]ACL59139.1 ABC transporter related [Methylobacterium nodulans ORS 2060]